MNKIIILGSGTSTGVPILGCKCKVCQSLDTRNKRLRTSALIETPEGKRVLIDASPDLRTQLLRESIDSLDAVIITHDHADHTHGIDDVRPLSFKSKADIPVHTDAETANSLRRKFPYIFDREKEFASKPILGGGIPMVRLSLLAPGIQSVAGEEMEFFSLPHGHTRTLALRNGKMAYVVDCESIPFEVLESLKRAQLELLIIDCLRPTPHQTHLHLELALEYIRHIGPKKAALIHMGHDWDYPDLLSRLKGTNVFPACDGQHFLYSKI